MGAINTEPYQLAQFLTLNQAIHWLEGNGYDFLINFNDGSLAAIYAKDRCFVINRITDAGWVVERYTMPPLHLVGPMLEAR